MFCILLMVEPDFGAATVLFATAFGLLFLAGAQLRWVLVCAWLRPPRASALLLVLGRTIACGA